MIIIKPEIITEPKIISSNVAETDASVWNPANNYNVTDLVIYDHRIYEALANHTGSTIPPEAPLVWSDLGATNRYRLFDQIIGSPTSNLYTIVYTIRPGALVTGIAFFGLVANTARVQMVDPIAGSVYDNLIDLSSYDESTAYYSYYFSPVSERRQELTLLDLPNYPNADITVTIDNGSEIAYCGELVMGTQRVLGYTNYGTSVGIRDYSKKETDQFGNFKIVQRRYAKFAEYDVSFRNADLASIQRFLASIRATPCVWIGNPELEETIVYGYYKNFQLVISDLNFSDSSIEVEGLT